MNQLIIMQAIITTILNKKKVTRKFLAKQYEVSERTITRYIYIISESGIPIISYYGRNGGYGMIEGYKYTNIFTTKLEISRMISILESTKKKFCDNLNDVIINKLIYTSNL